MRDRALSVSMPDDGYEADLSASVASARDSSESEDLDEVVHAQPRRSPARKPPPPPPEPPVSLEDLVDDQDAANRSYLQLLETMLTK